MTIEILDTSGGWPELVTRTVGNKVTITELTELLIKEELLPSSGEGVYLLLNGSTEEELASYYPLMHKVIRLCEASTLETIFPKGEARDAGRDAGSRKAAGENDTVRGKIRIATCTMTQRLEQIQPYLKKPEQPADKSKQKWWKMNSSMESAAWGTEAGQETDGDEAEEPESPYEKEKLLCELGISVSGGDSPIPKGSTAQLWLYLIGFVLVAAFMVRCLMIMLDYSSAEEVSLLEPLLRNALIFLLPAALCMVAGKIAEVVGRKKDSDQKTK